MKKITSSLILILAVIFMMTSCDPEKISILPSITTGSVGDIQKTSANLSGDVTSTGGASVTSRGFYLSSFYVSAETRIDCGSGAGGFSYLLDSLEPGTIYYVRAFAINEVGTKLGQTMTFTTVGEDPIFITTTATSEITMSSAVSGGNISDFGDNIIIERGVVFNTTTSPTIDDSKVIYSGSDDNFICSITGLDKNIKYYVKAYATNSKGGTYYGEEAEAWIYALEDQDGNFYHTVVIGNQTWTVENFKATHYLNGDEIPEVTDNITWSELTTGARCYYDNNRANYEPTYGCLYNWYAANDPRGLAPDGWRLPTVDEVLEMARYLGGNDIAGGMIKEAGTQRWKAPNSGATNSSGFTALPGGNRGNTYSGEIGTFIDITNDAVFLTGDEYSPSVGWGFFVTYSTAILSYGVAFDKSYGTNVRFIKK
jgi:uncharacterized protein (TIGR02145 family)